MNGHWFLFMMIFIITRLLPSAINASDTKRSTTVFHIQLYVPKPWFHYFRSFSLIFCSFRLPTISKITSDWIGIKDYSITRRIIDGRTAINIAKLFIESIRGIYIAVMVVDIRRRFHWAASGYARRLGFCRTVSGRGNVFGITSDARE